MRRPLLLLFASAALHAIVAAVAGQGAGAPSPAKEISAKDARRFLKDLQKALSADDAKREIEATRTGVESAQQRAKASMPVVQRLAEPVLKKHGFSGLSEGMAAATTAGKRHYDNEVRHLLEAIGEAITGERKEGRVPDLAILASKFVAMDKDERSEALAKAEKVVEGLAGQPGAVLEAAEEYLAGMRGVVDSGDSFPEDTVVDLALQVAQAVEARKGKAPAPDPPVDTKALNRRINVFTEFLDKAAHERVRQRIQEVRKAGGPGNEL